VEEYHTHYCYIDGNIAEQFSQLCFIAYKGVESDKLIFSSRELQIFNVVIDKTNNLGLLVTAPSTSLYGREKSCNFLHKTVQEFCAAWYISKILSPQDRLNCINSNWNIARYNMVWRFYSGITGLNNTELLNYMLPRILVKSHYSEWRTLILLEYVYEAQNSKVCQLVGDHLGGNIYTGVSRLTLHAINYFLTQYNGEGQVITINGLGFHLVELCETFENSSNYHYIRATKLSLKWI